jgi:hypothetical protein
MWANMWVDEKPRGWIKKHVGGVAQDDLEREGGLDGMAGHNWLESPLDLMDPLLVGALSCTHVRM